MQGCARRFARVTPLAAGFAGLRLGLKARAGEMAPPRCTCAYRLYHFWASLHEGGAACSSRGERWGSKKRAESDKEATVAAYLGRRANGAAEDSADECDECDDAMGFAEDEKLLVSASLPCPASPCIHIWHAHGSVG